jgi:purine-cytosine permease-like protein
VLGIVIGTGLGAIAHYFLSARGPLHGVPQMVLAGLAFGFKGNALPAVLMSVTAGVGWFATNSVSGAYALATCSGSDRWWAADHRAAADRPRLLRAQPGAGIRALDVPGARA